MNYYTHYWAKSNNTEWVKLEFTEIQSRDYPSMAFIHGAGYNAHSAQKLVDSWNMRGRLMGDMGYQYSLTAPTDSV